MKKKGNFDWCNFILIIIKCRKCGRRFNPDRIRKHESVCIGPEPDVSKIKE
jgi:predicted Zn-ribbon and HTH transcriptional regulator